MAPEATLGNFNVFPDDVASARSEDIVNALDKAYEEGFHVANMSLSGGSRASTTCSPLPSTTSTRRT